MATKLCIIIPNYNKGEYIGQLLDSLEPQLTDEVQVILIDDASTDNSQEVIKNHSILPKITYIQHETNRWCSATRNTGLEYVWFNAEDKPWFCFIDSDDIVKPNYIQTLLGYINNNNDEFDTYVFRHDLIDVLRDNQPVKQVLTNTDSPEAGAVSNYDQLAIYTRLFNWDCFGLFNMNDEYRQRHCGEDFEFTTRVAKNKRLKYTNDVIYTYRWNTKNGQARLSGGIDREEQ